MFVAFVAVVLIASVPLFGGRLTRLAGIRLRLSPLLFVALVLQVLITDVIAGAPKALLVTLHLTTYAMAGVFLWVNRRLPGLVVLAFGGALNGIVIALNGGTLPASAAALRRAGIVVKPGDFANSGVLAHPHLAFLGDVFSSPSWLPYRNVVSIGDIITLLGAAVLLHAVCDSWVARMVPRRSGSARIQEENAQGATAPLDVPVAGRPHRDELGPDRSLLLVPEQPGTDVDRPAADHDTRVGVSDEVADARWMHFPAEVAAHDIERVDRVSQAAERVAGHGQRWAPQLPAAGDTTELTDALSDRCS